ncbi:hypothetical protein P7K49_036989 [Saguinus oedipus]|uniref:Uncharacterized protein n=1 Tax=Saguinus oedipus TaxID=9490 RepID=A0ABQ9TLX0_SAGOE|nr:hypothetical protein P7K49_036989 [Saguinus oedipus]
MPSEANSLQSRAGPSHAWLCVFTYSTADRRVTRSSHEGMTLGVNEAWRQLRALSGQIVASTAALGEVMPKSLCLTAGGGITYESLSGSPTPQGKGEGLSALKVPPGTTL